MEIVIFEGEDLSQLLDFFAGLNPTKGTYRLRFAVEGGLKVKANEGIWSPPIGRMADPGGY